MMKSDDFRYCVKLARERDYGRYLCALAAPSGLRNALFVLLAFNDELGKIREIVSEPGLGDIRLAWWRETLEKQDSDIEVGHPVARALKTVISQTNVAAQTLQNMIDGRARDMDPMPFESPEEIAKHAGETAGNLALASLQVLNVAGEENQKAAMEVAKAWALIGLLRSLPYHERAGRRLLSTRVSAFDVMEAADDFLIAARGRARSVSKQAHPVLLAARLCDQYLLRLQSAKGDPWKANFEFAPLSPVWRIISGRLSGHY